MKMMIFVKYGQFFLIFALVRTAILFRFFFQAIKIKFFCKGYSPKWKTKKQNQKRITRSIKNNYKKDHKSIVKTLLKMRKLKNEIILTIESKKMSNKERKGKYKAEIITIKEKK